MRENPQLVILRKVCQIVENKKGENLVVLDISQVSSFTDFFVLCHGANARQNQAICDSIRESLKAEDHLTPSHVEGYEGADWILMDYLDFIVHIFSPESRDFYKLERLWSDGVEIDQAQMKS